MALSKEEWERRLKAILILKGMDLAELKHAVHDNGRGLPVNAAARAGHPSDNYPPNEALAAVVAKLLDVPVAWFEAEDWRPLIRESLDEADADSPATKADLAALDLEQNAAFAEVHKALEDVQQQLGLAQEGREGTEG